MTTINDYNIYRININVNNIYKLEKVVTNTNFYFYSYKDYNYGLLDLDKNYHILKINEFVEDLNDTLITNLKEDLKENFSLYDLKKYKISYFSFDDYYKPRYNYTFEDTDYEKFLRIDDLTNAKKKLLNLNQQLNKKCNNLSLELNYLYNMKPPNNKISFFSLNGSFPHPESLILCLFDSGCGCISSIIIEKCMFGNKFIEISSKTDNNFENKKYNTLLRCVIILISKLMSNDIEYIYSQAINSISFHLLMKYFGGILANYEDKIDHFHYVKHNDEFFNYLQEKNITLNPTTTDYKSLFEDYTKLEYEKCPNRIKTMLVIRINLTPENINQIETIFESIIGKLIC
jgi:DNA-binding XRE family transcriptional regulator